MQHLTATIIMALVANALNDLLLWLLTWKDIDPAGNGGTMFRVATTLLSWMTLSCVVAPMVGAVDIGISHCAMYGTIIVATFALLLFANTTCSSKNDEGFFYFRQLAAVAMLVIPAAMVGPLLLMSWERSVRYSSAMTLLFLAAPLMLLSLYRIVTIRNRTGNNNNNITMTKKLLLVSEQRSKMLRSVFLLVTILTSSPRCLSRGMAYLAPTVLQGLAGTELVRLAVVHAIFTISQRQRLSKVKSK